MRFGVLGPLAVWDDEGKPVRVPEAKVRALLADLLLHEGRTVSAERLIDDLWGRALPGNPANALQAKVSQLRRAIGRDRVVRQPPGYRLRVDADTRDEIDAGRFRSLAERARGVTDPQARADLLTDALAMWRGPAYADLADEDFVRAAAQGLEEQRIAVLEEWTQARLDAGDHVLLSGELADLVARHPLRERLRALHLLALYRAGRTQEALIAYADLRERLAEELGLDPSPELTALHASILRQDASLTPDQRQPAGSGSAGATHGEGPGEEEEEERGKGRGRGRGLGQRRREGRGEPDRTAESNLPAPLTSLIGRGDALDALANLLTGARLVTLTGPGGVGKTRLAIEAAGRLAGAAPDGVPDDVPNEAPDEVRLVELAGLRGDAADLAQAVSAVLGIRDPARLAPALRDRRTLLILDNCEHVVDAVAELTAGLLAAAPALRVLATSQEPLALSGEVVVPVGPLAPDAAAELFTARAKEASPGFTVTESSAALVAELCARLDGIPLALELAATRVRALGLEELSARLGDRFRLLGAGRRGVPARQQTLRAVIDWSWELLSAPERTVLARLSVHPDGCALDAAEEVCAGDGIARQDVLDLVTRLVDRSLIVPGNGRFRLLESVSAYAQERLAESGEGPAVRARHLGHYLALAEAADRHLRGPDQRTWLARLDAEAANLRTARATAAGTPDAARLATALTWWWLVRGRLTEAHRALSEIRELPLLERSFALLTTAAQSAGAKTRVEDGTQGLFVWLSAYALAQAGDPEASEQANERAHALFTAADDRWGVAATLALRATLAHHRGDLTTIRQDGERGAALFRELGDRWGELQTVPALASLAEIKGDYPRATRLHTEGLRIAEDLGLEAEVAARLSSLGRLALLAHDWDRARALHERALRLSTAQGYKYGEIHALMGLALGSRRSGDLDAAEAHLLRIRDADVSSAIGEHLLAAELGFTAELRGDAPGAREHHLRGLDTAMTLAQPRALALSLEGLAGAAVLAGYPADGALLLGGAHTARDTSGAPLPPAERTDVDRITAAATAALGPAAFAQAFRSGAALPPDRLAVVARRSS
ncbi:winged helix-turn-helix domain-containing protein [Streptomyces sp. APSN-46.1]|uniref:AfsR/SARP family transcriptional regulator n=1 Tax=Streptomyces sp. APSN-46.1 TaxID=2929049 RepID=UPI001FB53248|nr:BTAD domain-containing putative transcriptional regulator [Streptomyces sp. APSN-46.1]MCJ1676403.1 winged helix-turn-helix domain-containing protein [Streptomyces sp. APSN-46.1]